MPPLRNNTAARLDRMPAWVDVVQGASGLVLVLFMWVHMLLVSSILLGKEAMYHVARFLEGVYFFGRPYPQLVTGIAVAVFLLMIVHAVAAMRRMERLRCSHHTGASGEFANRDHGRARPQRCSNSPGLFRRASTYVPAKLACS